MTDNIDQWMLHSSDALLKVCLDTGKTVGSNGPAEWLLSAICGRGDRQISEEQFSHFIKTLAEKLVNESMAELYIRDGIVLRGVRFINCQNALVTIVSSNIAFPGRKALMAFENNVAGIYESSFEGKLISFNDAFCELLGYKREELLELKSAELYVHPKERDEFIELISINGKINNREIRYQRKDESIAWCVENAFIFENGERKHIIGTLVDITEQKRNKDRFENLFFSSADAVFLIEGSQISQANNRSSEIFGYSAEELFLLEVFHPKTGLFLLSDADIAVITKNFNSLKSGESERKKLIARRKNNSLFHSEVIFSKFQEAGASTIQLVVRDISERVLYEEAIRESEERFKLLAQVSIEGVAFVTNRIITDCNPQFSAFFGYSSSEEVIGKRLNEFIGESELSRLEQTIDIRSVNKTEVLTKAKTGQSLVLEVTCSDIEYQQKDMQVFMFYDVTSRKRAEKALEQTTERYRSLVEQSPNGIFILTDGRIKYVNQSGINLLDAEEEDDLYDIAFIDFFNQNDAQKLEEDLIRTREGEDVSYREYRIIDRSGNEIFVGFKPTLTAYGGSPSIQVTTNNLSVQVQLMQETMRAEIAEEINIVLKREIEEHKRTQDKLRAAENFTRNIIQSSIDMIIAVDRNRKITEFNPAAQVQFGYTLHEVIGQDITMLFKNKAEGKRILKEIQDNQTFSGEIINITHSGKEFTSLLSASIIRDESGVVFGSMGVSRDITELKKAEKELRESEERYRDLFENATDFIFSIDGSGKFKYANNAFCEKIGVTASTISSLTIQSITKGKLDKNLFDWFGERTLELTLTSKSGEEIQVFGSTTIRRKNDKPDSLRGIFRDVTALRMTEQRAREQGAKLDSIFNSTENMMIWTLNKSGQVTSRNENFIKWLKHDFGIELEINGEETFFDVLNNSINRDLDRFDVNLFKDVFKGKPKQFELPLITSHGENEWFQLFLNPVRVHDTIEEISCLAYDITDRKEMDRRILGSLKEKEVLLQEVHHRVKNNLQVISSILNLQSSFVDDDRILGILEESQSRIKTMSFIHETLYQTADFSSIDFSEYINTLAKNLVQSYSRIDCRIELETDFQDISLNLDQAIPSGLIVNELVSNAMKHAFKNRTKGLIKLSVTEKGGKVTISVSDNGVGLPDNFDPKESDSLGIYLVHALIEQLDAQMEIISRSGTTFLITFEKQ
jgi:PAS domain S-box-containing protein